MLSVFFRKFGEPETALHGISARRILLPAVLDAQSRLLGPPQAGRAGRRLWLFKAANMQCNRMLVPSGSLGPFGYLRLWSQEAFAHRLFGAGWGLPRVCGA